MAEHLDPQKPGNYLSPGPEVVGRERERERESRQRASGTKSSLLDHAE